MRKILYCGVMLTMILNLASCSNATLSSDQGGANDSATMFVPVTSLYVEETQIRDIFEPFDNFLITEDLYINIPDLDTLQKYQTRIIVTQEYTKYEQDFMDIFKYLFPNESLNENALFYGGENSHRRYGDDDCLISDYHLVKDYRDALISGTEGQVWLIYDESYIVEDMDSPIYMELGVMTGYGYAEIDKGKIDALNIEKIATYTPDSREQFTLSGEEVAICDAVSFFEEYINQIPQSYDEKTTAVETCVAEVDVYQIGEQQFGYSMIITKRYNGVMFDYMRNGTSHSDFGNYSFSMGNAFMTCDDDVDMINSYYRTQQIENAEALDTILSLETATDIICNSLSKQVTFDVEKIELTYCAQDILTDDGYIDIEGGYSTKITPAWKFTLYNQNDAIHYICYVDVDDADSFRYYTTA